MTTQTYTDEPQGVIVRITRYFLTGPAAPIFIVGAAIMGMVALWATPQEEEPQIVVPMVDVLVEAPGLAAPEVEQQVTRPLERILWQVQGVEHVYSISRQDQAMVMVRFFVGEDREKAIVNVRDQMESHRALVPPAAKSWLVVPAQIDDVPILQLTFFSTNRPLEAVRRIVEETKARLDGLDNISRSELYGGQPREILIEPDVEALAARGLCLADIVQVLQGNETGGDADTVVQAGQRLAVRPRPALDSAAAVQATVLRSPQDRAVRVGDVATVSDQPREQDNYHHIIFGPQEAEYPQLRGQRLPAVTLAFAKKKGTDATRVAAQITTAVAALRATVIPADVGLRVTRDYGYTAREKVNSLLANMVFAIITVVALLAFTMGIRESLIVGLAVPISFALALFVNYLAGYSINRVTLFALILSLGLVVDDPITNVDSIQRHIRLGLRAPLLAAQWGVRELIVPVIVSTLTIIMAFLPMLFITGMMGPYMRPMAINVPLAVSFSTVCALTFVPWLAYRLLKHRSGEAGAEGVTPAWIRRGYHAMLAPFLDRRRGVRLLWVVALLFGASCLLVPLGLVPLKMLPFDNKDELQLVLDLPEGSTLEQTDRLCQELEQYLAGVAEVRDLQTYTGINSPVDFNGLVRHYNYRQAPHQAEIRINLAGKNRRVQQSHDIALRIRNDVTRIAAPYNAVLSIVEVPPGPPVISTITAEVSGAPTLSYAQLIAGAQELEARMRAVDPVHITQIDDTSEMPRPRLDVVIDRDKAARHGLLPAEISQALRMATRGHVLGATHAPHERDPLLIRLRLPYAARAQAARLEQLWLRGRDGARVQLGELAAFAGVPEEQPIYHKNLERIVFVTAEAVGRAPGNIILEMAWSLWRTPLAEGIRVVWAGEGEWQITADVFRDLGIAFGVALIGIYLLLVLQTGTFALPAIMMLAIPLTAIGVLPGFWLLNLVTSHTVGGYPTPTFFTATAMIGMIALGGIVIRNSSVLIEFVQQAVAEGSTLRQALLDAGAVRFRPIILTALTTLLGVWPITLDPIFSGLAWALIFGLIASTAFTTLVIPTVYYLLYAPRTASGDQGDAA